MTTDGRAGRITATCLPGRLAIAGETVHVAVRSIGPDDGDRSLLARSLGRDMAAAALGLSRTAVTVASLLPSGRPVLRVHGQEVSESVSLAHVEDCVAGALAHGASVGIDLVDPAVAGRGLDFWFTPEELALEADDGLLRARLWAAKEAAFKAAAFDVELRPRTVVIDSLAPCGFTWSAVTRYRRTSGSGVFGSFGRYVVAIALTSTAVASSQGSAEFLSETLVA